MNKMATAMQEGEYDSEKPQNKVNQNFWDHFDVVSPLDVRCFFFFHFIDI